MTPTQQRIVDLVRSYDGVSMDCQPALLGQLMARNVDDPHQVYDDKTNCGTVSLGFLWLLGVKHHRLSQRYVTGMAISWLVELGNELGILHPWHGDRSVLVPGLLLWYHTDPNNDHVEWLLGEVDAEGNADHGGGGRTRNAITVENGPVLSSWGRPLIRYWDVPAALEAA